MFTYCNEKYICFDVVNMTVKYKKVASALFMRPYNIKM